LGKRRGARYGCGVKFEPLECWGAFEEAGYVSIEWEGGGESLQAGVCDGASVWSEDPAEVGIDVEGEMERRQFGHSRERVPERAIKWTKDVNGGVDRDAEGAHDTGDARFVGESDDDGQVALCGGEDEVAVEDALHDGTKERTGARECGEVGGTEMGADDVEELDGEARESHCKEWGREEGGPARLSR
jgi:hypothetical protein